MYKEKSESWLWIGVFAAVCWWATAAYPVGILAVRVQVEPARIKPGDKIELFLEARDGFERPLGGVAVKITSEKGRFEPTGKPLVQGATDRLGQFKTVWQSDKDMPGGPQEFAILASRNGYIGRYPIMARVLIEGPSPREQDLEQSPAGEGGTEDEEGAVEHRFDPRRQPLE